MTRPNLNAVALVPSNLGSAVASTGFHVLRTKRIAPEWLYYAVQSTPFVDAMVQLVQGVVYPAVRPKDINGYSVPLPPVAEQRRIVAAIEEHLTRIDDAVASLRRVQVNLRRYRASVLKAACEGRLVPTEAALACAESRDYEPVAKLLAHILQERAAETGRLFVGSEPSRDSALLPDGWTWATVGQIGEVQGGIQKQPKRAPRRNAFPFLRVANVLRGRLDLREIHEIELFGDELNKLRLEPGDLLIVEGNGSPSEIGRMAVWAGAIRDCVHQNHIIRVRLAHGIEARYVESYWNSPAGSDAVMRVASSTSGLYTLSVSKVNRLLVPLPPAAEQKRIVAEVERRLSVIEELEILVKANLVRAERLQQAILRRAFEGKLVPQDPTDEPARSLLDRIRAEREAGAQGRNGRGRRAPARRAEYLQAPLEV